MAKKAKKAPPKKPAKAPAKKLGTSKARQDAARSKAKTSKPKSTKPRGGEQMELIKGVRYSDLDSFCRQVGNHIDEGNEARRSKGNVLQSALTSMRKHGVTGYNYAGITLMRTVGDEKITAKKDKGEGTSAGGALNQPADPETGSGQDAGEIADRLTDNDEGDPEQ